MATGMVLLAAKGDPRSTERVAHFVEVFFPRFAELQVPSRSASQNGVKSTLLRACRDSAARKPQRHGSMRAPQRLGQSRLWQAPMQFSLRQRLKHRGAIKRRCSNDSSNGGARRTISARK